MMALIARAMSLGEGMRQSALAAIPEYKSRGKGQGGRNKVAPGAGMAAVRAAKKRRNVMRHRALNR